MNYIDLNLKKHNQQGDDRLYLLVEVIQDNKLIVLLGAPGSGKTSILKKYQSENNNVEIFSIKEFIKLDFKPDKNTHTLLLDGLDEYRSIETDKTFVVNELAHKIKKLDDAIKVVISCREMDWYGETDRVALKDEIDKELELYNIMPLDEEQKKSISKFINNRK